jgi:hypothetical protein
MLVLVVGNINSGKSHAIELIRPFLPEYPVLAIDEYRIRFGDGSLEGELRTRERFVNDVVSSDHVIVELSGMGPLGSMLESRITLKSFIVVHIQETLANCLERIQGKDFSKIPYPKFNETLPDTIARIQHEIEHGDLKKFWEKKALAFFSVSNNQALVQQFNEIPFQLYEKAELVLSKLLSMEEVREIIMYGSIARKSMTVHSDIDLLVSSELSLQDMEDQVSNLPGVTFHDTPDGKVTLYFNHLLVEIVVVKNLESHAKYYVNSFIEDIEGSIVKGNHKTLDTLLAMQTAFYPNVEEMKSETIKRLVFFVRSLPGIAKKDDAYKYFFHVNIVIHEIIRLEQLLHGDVQFLYLPKQVKKHTILNMSKLTYCFETNYNDHYKSLIQEIELFQVIYNFPLPGINSFD